MKESQHVCFVAVDLSQENRLFHFVDFQYCKVCTKLKHTYTVHSFFS